jgi:hypothetical protein
VPPSIQAHDTQKKKKGGNAQSPVILEYHG